MSQIRCEPYRCTISESSCAARHARSQVAPRAGLVRHAHTLCVTCPDGAERAARLGTVSSATAKAGVDFRRIRSKSLEVYAPRNGCP